ncbi:uncharacterized protein LOC144360727 [Saccoglossus kowalevskii]
MFSKLCWNAEYVKEECWRKLSSMGVKPSFPVVVEPILYEPQTHFTSTGRRRVINNRRMVVKYQLTTFQKINNQIYQDVGTQRRMTLLPKRKLHRADFKRLCQKYPRWGVEHLAEFRFEFIKSDIDEDGLLNFVEYCSSLDRLDDDSLEEDRLSVFQQHVSLEFPEHVDFEEFIHCCDLLYQARTKQADNVQLIEVEPCGNSNSSGDSLEHTVEENNRNS